jgi:hypothetical protein
MSYYKTVAISLSGGCPTIVKSDPNQPPGSYWAETPDGDGPVGARVAADEASGSKTRRSVPRKRPRNK